MTKQPRRIGKFEILDRLGEGAMGEVFLARDAILGREVALKTIHPATLAAPEARDRFFREAQAAGRLNHPNLVTVHEFGEDQGILFMAMEYVPGQDLAQAIQAAALQPAELLEVLAQVCDGLAYAHQRGVLHRDIKPSNIRITRVSGRLAAKVLDFGIARLAGSDLTATGTLLGSFGYMAPEYIQSGKPDARADLFAVGVILYEALAGFRPFDGESTATVLHRIINEEPPPLDLARLAGISPAIQEVAARALAKTLAGRYPSAEALAADLRAARDPWWHPGADKEATVSSASAFLLPGRTQRPAAKPGGNGVWPVLALAVLLAGGAGGGWLWYRHNHRRPAPPPVTATVPAPAPPLTPPSPSPAQPEPAQTQPAKAEPAKAAAEPPRPAPPPPAKAGIDSLDAAAAALDRDPKAALAYLEPLAAKEPDNERALALRMVALYDTGDYRGCARAMVQARAAGHLVWPMALKYPRLRKMLEQEKTAQHLPRRRPAQAAD